MRWQSLFGSYVERMTQFPRRMLLAIGLVLMLCVYGVVQLKVSLNVVELLPAEVPELQGRKQMLEAYGGSAELVLAVKGPQEKRLFYTKQLVDELRQSPQVLRADVEFSTSFFQDRWLYFLSLEQLDELQQKLAAAIHTTSSVGLAGKLGKVQNLYQQRMQNPRWRTAQQFLTNPTITSEDGNTLFVFIQPLGALGDFSGKTERSIHKIQSIIDQSAVKRHGFETQLSGRMLVMLEENRQTMHDMQKASLLAFGLIIALLLLFTRRLQVLLVIALPLIVGIVFTLAATSLFIGRINMVSGFMIPALAGLGVDFCIHLYLRFLHCLQAGTSQQEAVKQACHHVFAPCLIAALTTSVAFMALMLNHFEGVSEYGMIASVGVPLTFVATFTVLPPLLVLIPHKPKKGHQQKKLLKKRNYAFPILSLAFVLVLFSIWRAPTVSFHNDFQALRGESKADRIYRQTAAELGGPSSTTIFMVNNLVASHQTAKVIQQVTEQQPPEQLAQFGFTLSLAHVLPLQQQEKQQKLAKIQRTLQVLKAILQAHPQLYQEVQEDFLGLLHASKAQSWTKEDIPRVFAARLMAKDGNSSFVYLAKKSELSVDQDIHQWAEDIRRVLAMVRAKGSTISVLDEGCITDRMIMLLKQDMLPMLAFSGFCVLFIIAISFRRWITVCLLCSAVFSGIIIMLGCMSVLNIQLNFFNVVVLPSILGIGIDNAIHIQHAYQSATGDFIQVLQEKGAAIVLSSLTTTIGFGAMVVAQHGGVWSLGWLAIIGMLSMFFCSSIVLPAALSWVNARAQK